MNKLTSKITCNHDSAAVGNVTTKYYSINITGTSNAANFSLPTKSSNLSSTGTTGFYNTKFIPLLPQYQNSSNQSAAVDVATAVNTSNTISEAATYDNIFDNTHLIKETSSDDSSSSSSSKEDSHDKHDSDNNDKSSSDDREDNSNDNHSTDNSSGNKEKSNGNDKVEIHTAKHLKSTKVEKTGHDKDKLNFKHHNDNIKSGNLHNYIHDLVKKKIKVVSESIFA